MSHPRRGRVLLSTLLVVGLLLAAGGASAETTRSTATFGAITGPSRDFATTMQLAGTGYPLAQVTTNASSATLPSGASTWYGETTAPGQEFGSSRNQRYLNLGTNRDDASSPSVTTYTFPTAAPVGWGFVLGDIDSDKVRVSATLADGSAASTGQLGFHGVFNPCTPTPRPSGCSGPEPKDTPAWDADAATLTGNPTGANTYGASGWFVPTVPLKTLTLTFTWRTGFPIYQTWFASRAQDVTGTVDVTDGACDVTASTLNLLDRDGGVLATTSPAADGTYSFDRVAATDEFSVQISDVPVGCELVGSDSRDLDLTTDDDTADFAMRQVVSGTASGQVTDTEGDPVPDAVIDVTGPGGYEESVTTDDTGSFTLPGIPPGTYEATLDPPDGFEVDGPATKPLVVPPGGGPVDLDFVVRPAAVTPAPSPSPSPTPSATTTPTTSTSSGTGYTSSGATTYSSSSTLPDVGAPSLGWLALALGLLAAGGVLVRRSTRRR